MAAKHLGPEFWIHGGGMDLVFPHHENERAQSRAVGHPYAKVWMHNGLLRFTGEKMSKSVGNVASIQDVIAEWGAETALLFFMTAHWRKPIDFSPTAMESAHAHLESFRNAYTLEPREAGPAEWGNFVVALEDDFNTAQALAVLSEWRDKRYLDLIARGFEFFGLSFDRLQTLLPEGIPSDAAVGVPMLVHIQFLGNRPPDEIFELARRRFDARLQRDFAVADQCRYELDQLGYEARDLPNGYVIVRSDRTP
jgi:cysteinyl-tRNA synthetase